MPSQREFLVKYSGRFFPGLIDTLLAQKTCVYIDEIFPNEQSTLLAKFSGTPPGATEVSVRSYEIAERIKETSRPRGVVDFWMLLDTKMYSPLAERMEDSIVTEAIKEEEAFFEVYGIRGQPNLWMRGACSSTAKIKEIESKFRKLLRQDRFSVYGVYARRLGKGAEKS